MTFCVKICGSFKNRKTYTVQGLNGRYFIQNVAVYVAKSDFPFSEVIGETKRGNCPLRTSPSKHKQYIKKIPRKWSCEGFSLWS